VADRVGADLPGNIDLQGGVNRNHLVVLGDIGRQGVVVDGVELEYWVVIHVVVQSAGTHAESSQDLTGVERFAPVGHHARFDQIDQPIGKHLGVDAQILLFPQPV